MLRHLPKVDLGLRVRGHLDGLAGAVLEREHVVDRVALAFDVEHHRPRLVLHVELDVEVEVFLERRVERELDRQRRVGTNNAGARTHVNHGFGAETASLRGAPRAQGDAGLDLETPTYFEVVRNLLETSISTQARASASTQDPTRIEAPEEHHMTLTHALAAERMHVHRETQLRSITRSAQTHGVCLTA
eukprot:6182307-Pleurochrysis_carterae.AAC.2